MRRSTKRMNGSLLASVAAAALLAATAVAGAQTAGQPDRPGAAQDKVQTQQDSGDRAGRAEPKRDEGRAQPSPRSRRDVDQKEGQGAKSGASDEGGRQGTTKGRAQRNERGERDGAGDRGQAGERGQSGDRGQAEQGRRDQDKNKGESGRTGETPSGAQSEPRSTQGQPRMEPARPKAGETEPSQGRMQRESEPRGERADRDRGSLNENQKTQIRENIMRRNPRTQTDVNFSVSVGRAVPRNVELQTLPPDIARIVPRYRGYKYLIVRDEIVIVHPRTNNVVTVIRKDGAATTGSRPSGERLTFTQTQREMIRRHATRRTSEAERIDLTVGGAVPSSVEIYEFPDMVYTEIPALRRYRYLVVDDEVVLVDPDEHRIVHILRE